MRNYRGLTKDGKWVCGDKVEIGKRCWIVSHPELAESDDMRDKHCSIWGFVEVQPESVGQFTGLKDGDFWEQDILQSEDKLRKYVIKWSNVLGRWVLEGLGEAWNEIDPEWHGYTKIGNVTDNLLGAK